MEKSAGVWRLVVDLSLLKKNSFKTGTVVLVLSSIRKDDFMAPHDMKDVYLQIYIHFASRKHFSFILKGVL